MKEKELREKWEKWLRGGIRLLMATGVCFTVVACYAPYYAPEPSEGWGDPWSEQNPNDTTQVDSTNDMRAQRAAQKAKIEKMAENLHNDKELK